MNEGIEDNESISQVNFSNDEEDNETSEIINVKVNNKSAIKNKPQAKKMSKLNTVFIQNDKSDFEEKSPKSSKFNHKNTVKDIGIRKQFTSVKELSPNKSLMYNQSTIRGGRGSSKALREVRKIIEKWPVLEATIEEMKDSIKQNKKSISDFGDNLSEFQKEINEILRKKTDGLYSTIQEEIKKLEVDIGNLFESEGLKPAIENVKILELKVEKLNIQFDSVNKQNKNLSRRVDEVQELANSPFSHMMGGEAPVYDDTAITEMKETVKKLNHTMNKTKTDVFRGLKEVEDKLLNKADEDVINNLEEALHQGIDQVMTSSAKKFADRRDTNKAVRLLERNMKNMYDLFTNKDEINMDTDDAMLSKKNLGFTCMSCEKNLVNLEGKKVDFNNWGKMPFREPSERILRVGQGFSKMLSQIKPEMSKITESKERHPPGRNSSMDLEIAKTIDYSKNSSVSLFDMNQDDNSQLPNAKSTKKLSKIKITKKISE